MKTIVTGESKDFTGKRYTVCNLAGDGDKCSLEHEAAMLANRMGVKLTSARIDSILEIEDIEKPGKDVEPLSYFIKHATGLPAKTY